MFTISASPQIVFESGRNGCQNVYSPWLSDGTVFRGYAMYDIVPYAPNFEMTIDGEPWGDGVWSDDFEYPVFAVGNVFNDNMFFSKICVRGLDQGTVGVMTLDPTPGVWGFIFAIPFWIGWLVLLFLVRRRLRAE